ncbi:uncharacterized protein LOC124811258 isoform X3 [Hydra vulgaris]|uniref:uncharacterized protein LOC124811258 isoform X3 n=1 Tax=Hydra vulgaris TaxID=6087 RepID=UPI001F5E64E2|nr:uncharacterized protein LOC124811258 isoform X3 [Hydra vulgaris]
MVKWNDVWLEKLDKNLVKIQLWAEKRNSEYAICKLCKSDLKFSSVGFQALYQHSSKPKHKSVSDLRFSKTASHLYVDSNKNSIGGEKVIQLEFSTNEKISAAEAMWLFKVAENDLALRHCDNTPILFQRMFPDSKISHGFTMSRQKASYILQDGLGPLLEKRLCNSITLSQVAFTLMFDETTTSQQRKQMDLLCRFWSEDENQVVTKYLTSLFFGRATAEDVKTMLADLRHNERFYLPWDRLFNISADGPNINKAIWRLIIADLHSNGFNGLLPFVSCTLHTVHNAFRKAINVVGEDAEQLAFDLHNWFKNAPCKIEDFKKLSDCIFIEDETLFLRFVNTRWLTLSSSLIKVLLRWEDTKKYFLEYIPKQKEYKKTLTNNKRYIRIQRSLRETENELLVSIKFLIGLAPLFEKYLTIFQDEGPLVHILFYKMKNLLISLMKRFLQPNAVNGKLTKDLLKIDSSDSTIHLDLNKMDFGEEAKNQVSFVKDEWKLYQAANISKDWYIDFDTKKLKRVDHYWAKVFESNNEYGKTKYGYLSKVVKSCLTIQNGNASAERSLSDNKNTLTPERVNLNDETLMALRISKEYARSCRGAYNVDALSKDFVQAVQNAHKIYKKRKAEEDEEKRKNYIHEQELMNKEKEQKEMLEKVENKNKNLDQQEKSLKNDEKNADLEFQLAQRMLDEAAKSMQSAIIKEDMMGIKIAHEMVNSAKRSLENATSHRNEQKKLRENIGLKRKSEMDRLIKRCKKLK